MIVCTCRFYEKFGKNLIFFWRLKNALENWRQKVEEALASLVSGSIWHEFLVKRRKEAVFWVSNSLGLFIPRLLMYGTVGKTHFSCSNYLKFFCFPQQIRWESGVFAIRTSHFLRPNICLSCASTIQSCCSFSLLELRACDSNFSHSFWFSYLFILPIPRPADGVQILVGLKNFYRCKNVCYSCFSRCLSCKM